MSTLSDVSKRKHYGDKDGLLVLSRNAIITAVLSNRNYGKTWTFKKRAFKRALKHGKKTIWLRLFKKEVKEAIASFFKSKDLRAYCGIKMYDKDTCKDGNCKQIGNTFFYRKKVHGKWTRWDWFLKLYCVNDQDAVRGADDVDTDTVVFDEFTKEPHKYVRYRGNIVTDFIDIFFSTKREHQVRCIIIGNKESYNNPFFTYFGIKPLPTSYEGIRSFRKGSFIVQQINNLPFTDTEYDKKLFELFKGTPYGDYLYSSEYKNKMPFKPRKAPHTATLYCQLSIKSMPLKILCDNGFYYVNDKIDKTKRVFCDAVTNKYSNENLLVKRYKRYFTGLIDALADNRVYYSSPAVYESMMPFLQWLSI